MNVLFLARLYSPHIGGVEKHVEEVSKKLIERGHTIKVVCEKHDPKLRNYEKLKGVEVFRIPPGNKWKIWRWWFDNLQLFYWADVIHIHDVFFWFLPFRFIFPFINVFMTFHGYEAPGPPNWRQVFWHRLAAYLTRGNISVGDFHSKWYSVKSDFVTYGAVA